MDLFYHKYLRSGTLPPRCHLTLNGIILFFKSLQNQSNFVIAWMSYQISDLKN